MLCDVCGNHDKHYSKSLPADSLHCAFLLTKKDLSASSVVCRACERHLANHIAFLNRANIPIVPRLSAQESTPTNVSRPTRLRMVHDGQTVVDRDLPTLPATATVIEPVIGEAMIDVQFTMPDNSVIIRPVLPEYAPLIQALCSDEPLANLASALKEGHSDLVKIFVNIVCKIVRKEAITICKKQSNGQFTKFAGQRTATYKEEGFAPQIEGMITAFKTLAKVTHQLFEAVTGKRIPETERDPPMVLSYSVLLRLWNQKMTNMGNCMSFVLKSKGLTKEGLDLLAPFRFLSFYDGVQKHVKLLYFDPVYEMSHWKKSMENILEKQLQHRVDVESNQRALNVSEHFSFNFVLYLLTYS